MKAPGSTVFLKVEESFWETWKIKSRFHLDQMKEYDVKTELVFSRLFTHSKWKQ